MKLNTIEATQKKYIGESEKNYFFPNRNVKYVPIIIGTGSVGLAIGAYVLSNPILAAFAVVGGSFCIYQRMTADSTIQAVNSIQSADHVVVSNIDFMTLYGPNSHLSLEHSYVESIKGLALKYQDCRDPQKVRIIQFLAKFISSDMSIPFGETALESIKTLIDCHLKNDLGKVQIYIDALTDTLKPALISIPKDIEATQSSIKATRDRFRSIIKAVLMIATSFEKEKKQNLIDCTELDRSIAKLLQIDVLMDVMRSQIGNQRLSICANSWR